jgi:hypothetical protein
MTTKSIGTFTVTYSGDLRFSTMGEVLVIKGGTGTLQQIDCVYVDMETKDTKRFSLRFPNTVFKGGVMATNAQVKGCNGENFASFLHQEHCVKAGLARYR